MAYKFGGTEALKNSLVLGMTTAGAGKKLLPEVIKLGISNGDTVIGAELRAI